MNKKAVIFDMDGVIFDTERIYLETWEKVFKDYGYNFRREVYIKCMGRGRKVVKQVFLEEFGENLPIEEIYIKKDQELFKIIEEEGVPLKEGAVELLDFLNKNNIKVALATSAKSDRTNAMIDDKKIREKFDYIVTGENVEKLKPNPDIFLKAAKGINVKPENAVVIEDSKSGVLAGFNANMKVFHIEDLLAPDEEIKKYAFKMFKSLNQIKEYLESVIKNRWI